MIGSPISGAQNGTQNSWKLLVSTETPGRIQKIDLSVVYTIGVLESRIRGSSVLDPPKNLGVWDVSYSQYSE